MMVRTRPIPPPSSGMEARWTSDPREKQRAPAGTFLGVSSGGNLKQTKESRMLNSMLTSMMAPEPSGAAALSQTIMFGSAPVSASTICTSLVEKRMPL